MEISVNGLKGLNEVAKGLANGHAITDPSYKHINDKLEVITQYLLQEIENKQHTIAEQRHEIERLKQEINQRSGMVADLEKQLSQCAEHTEGHRQLINKLLNDIGHLQKDVDWYKRTFEKRSIWGVLKDKLFKKKSP
ncbi:hypothetical protein [Longitalea luteola]|uniref:hypothetical protein n=1 Tax=Longitalea luteola TaxID=2812563 RepID=UPI001A959D36|nr:hypothetical protein [Longitalea luteola]